MRWNSASVRAWMNKNLGTLRENIQRLEIRKRINNLFRQLAQGEWINAWKNLWKSGWQNACKRVRQEIPRIKLYISLTRLDRPIGIYLLLWPTLWALWLAAEGWPGWHLFLVFTIGVVLTRSAGCVINDIVDRDFDHSVARTKDRPLATNQATLKEAMVLTGVLLLISFLLVLTTNLLTILLSVFAVGVAAIYPFMKRIIYMPQAVLGVAFSWGIPMAFAAHSNEVPQIAWLLLVANLLWTVAYDTEYAMVDREDDVLLGLKSSAILFGELDRLMIGILQAAFILTLVMVSKQAGLSLFFDAGLIVAAGFFLYQQYLLRNRETEASFQAFRNNQWAGLAIFAAIVLHFLEPLNW